MRSPDPESNSAKSIESAPGTGLWVSGDTKAKKSRKKMPRKSERKLHFFGVKNGKNAWFSRENEIANTTAKSGQFWSFIGGIPLHRLQMGVRTRWIVPNYAMIFKPQCQILQQTPRVLYVNACTLVPDPRRRLLEYYVQATI
jgi:hypothetical protein